MQLRPEEISQQLSRGKCPYCQGIIIPTIVEVEVIGRKRKVIRFPEFHGCPEEAAALDGIAAVKAAETQVQLDQEYKHRLDRAGLIGWLANASFDNFDNRDDWDEAGTCRYKVLNYAQKLLDDQLGPKNWLVLHGGYGTGKSHLAAVVMRLAIDLGDWSNVYFRVWTDYLLRIQKSYQDSENPDAETEADIIRELQTGRLVVLDDIDKRASEFTRRTLFSVINHRYNENLPTIFTFNLGPLDPDPKAPKRLALEEFLGRAVLDRVIERAYDVIDFNGPSYRSGVKWNGQEMTR